MEYLSKECYDGIVAELKNLIDNELPKTQADLAETRLQGDLSENYGYRASKRAHAKVLSRIRYLQKVLKYSRVIDPSALPTDKVTLLSKVEFTNLSTNTRMTYKIVSPHEANLSECKISFQSPIGAALKDKAVGDIVEVHAPAATFKLRIEKISLD
ncbi:MAG: transcription elongation factor GreA [Bacteroidales bacterium]|nr:transcription elongation factor GreA [Bacteroidales bacterium]